MPYEDIINANGTFIKKITHISFKLCNVKK